MLDHLEPSWSGGEPSWPGLPAARWAARRWTPCTASAPSPRWRSGRSWAMWVASPPPGCGAPPGLDITVYSSDGKRSPGHLARQGPPVRRRALFEAAKYAARACFPTTPTPPGKAAAGRQPCHPGGGPQAGPPLLPHPWRARRAGRRAAVQGPQLGRWPSAMRPVRALPTPLMRRGQRPHLSCRPRSLLAGPERTSGRTRLALLPALHPDPDRGPSRMASNEAQPLDPDPC
jgi:hypothetical protein